MRPFAATAAVAALVLVVGTLGVASAPATKAGKGQQATAASPPKETAEGDQPAPGKAGQAIVVLVNDEPVTAYEIDQRSRFIALNANVGDRVKETFKRMVQAESTNLRVRAILDEVVKANPGKTREQVLAIFEERKTQFAVGLQRQAMESVRAGMSGRFRKEAQEELIDERLKLQEAKRLGVDIGEEEVKRVMRGIAERNKMTEEQFAQNVKSQGVDIMTMRDRFKAQFAWREVIRRKFAAQISITQAEVDRLISASANEAGEDGVELQVQKITLAMPATIDQGTMAKRYLDAEALRRKFSGCKTMAELAKAGSDARFDDLKFIRPSSVPEPTRSLLLNAKDGDMLPPATTATGIEVYAVCGRRALKTDDKQREKVHADLAQQEFEIMAKRHLRDLRQDAHIDYR